MHLKVLKENQSNQNFRKSNLKPTDSPLDRDAIFPRTFNGTKIAENLTTLRNSLLIGI